MTIEKINKLKPSLLMPNNPEGVEIDEVVQAIFRTDLPVIESIMPEKYYLDRFASAVFYRIPYLKSLGYDFSSMNVLEIGCGRALKAIAWSKLFRKYWGVDHSNESIVLGQKLVSATGKNNIELIAGNAVDVMRDPAKYGISEKINCIIMYAVFEHLTLAERKVILETAKELLKNNGLLILSETPNRLIPHDGHSTFLHFFQSLPTELAIAYINRSPRSEARAIASSSENHIEALYRFGQAASYHEFELYLADNELVLPTIRADGWNSWPAADEPIRRDELGLVDYFISHNNIAHPAFARYWLEIVFDFGVGSDQIKSSPICIDRCKSETNELVVRPQAWDLDTVLCSYGGLVRYNINQLRPRLMQVDLSNSSGVFEIIDSEGRNSLSINIEEIKESIYKRWHNRTSIDLSMLNESKDIIFRPSSPSSKLAVDCLIAENI